MIIFDKDGTLIDIHHYWCSMIEFRAEFFTKNIAEKDKAKLYLELVDSMGIDLNTKKMKAKGPVGIKPRDYIENVALNIMQKHDKNYTKIQVKNIFKEVDEYSKSKLYSIVKLLPDVKRILEECRINNIQISIATTDITPRALLAMRALNLEDMFENIVGADLVKNAKPSADLVEYIIMKNNLNTNEVIVIGDSMADLNMAKNAKCKFIGVKTGLYDDVFLKNSEYIINNLKDLKVFS